MLFLPDSEALLLPEAFPPPLVCFLAEGASPATGHVSAANHSLDELLEVLSLPKEHDLPEVLLPTEVHYLRENYSLRRRLL